MFKKIRRIATLVVVVLIFPLAASAQDGSRAILSAPDLEEFPRITSFLDIRDAQGFFISGLPSSAVTVIEDGLTLPGQISEIAPGAQIVVAVNPGSAMGIIDLQGRRRYDYVSEAMVNWLISLGDGGTDDFSLVTPTGTLVSHSTNPTDMVAAWQTYLPEFGTSTPSLDILSFAIDIASDPTPQAGMGRVVLFFTPNMTTGLEEVIQSLADRAVQNNVRIYVGLIDAETTFQGPFAEQLVTLTSQTGGQLFTFSNVEAFPDFQAMFENARRSYQLVYQSQINEAGEHTLSVIVNTDGGDVLSEAVSFEIELRAPNPIFVAPPAQIVRAVPEDAKIAVENLEPKAYTFEIVIEFPDTISREIVYSALYANGQLVAENAAPPFEYFTLDLTAFEASEQIVLRAEVTDEIGLVGVSIDTPVEITVQRPQRGLMDALSRYGPAIALGFAGLAGGVLLLVLILAGRIRPRRIGERKRKRAAYEDPVTQPIRIAVEDEEKKSPTVLERFTRSLPMPRSSGKQSARARKEPYAYLIRISEEGKTDPDKTFEITSQEITFGSDASEAVVVLEDPAVEALHARLWRNKDGVFYLADKNSTSGTWLNYAPVADAGSRVKHGDLIHIAKTGFRFTLSNPTRPRKPLVTKKENK